MYKKGLPSIRDENVRLKADCRKLFELVLLRVVSVSA